MMILNSTIKQTKIPIRHLISGDLLSLILFHISGTDPKAPSVYIQANVHGSEIQGNAVIYELMQYIQKYPPLGNFTLVPLANPVSVNQKIGEFTYGTFDITSGANWNRSYWYATCLNENLRKDPDQINVEEFVEKSLELSWDQIKENFKRILKEKIEKKLSSSQPYGRSWNEKLTLTLQSFSCTADFVLDLHTGSKATRYLYLPEYALPSAVHFNIPHLLLIPHHFTGAMDEASFCPWWDLQKVFFQKGRKTPLDFESFTLEKGGQERLTFEEAKEDAQNILNYLKTKGVVQKNSPDIIPLKPKKLFACKIENFKTLYAPRGGLIHSHVSPGDQVKAQDPLVQILYFKENDSQDPNVLHKTLLPLLAPENCLVVTQNSSASVHEGQEVMSVMTSYWEVK